MGCLRTNLARRRVRTYLILSAVLIAGVVPLYWSNWQGTAELHTVIETVATVLATTAGAMALVRYYTRKSRAFLLLGSAFMGAALLDGYHAAITSTLLASQIPSGVAAVTPWSGYASRIFLAAFLCLSSLKGTWETDEQIPTRRHEFRIHLVVGLCTLVTFALFALVPMHPAYYQNLALRRPIELLTGALFSAAIFGRVRKGAWRTDQFEHWLILSLAVAAGAQLVYMPFSRHVFDCVYILSHVLKVAGYVLVLVGLFANMSSIFRRETEHATDLSWANEALTSEMDDRKRAEEMLRRAHDELEERVRGRTVDLLTANQALREENAERRRAEEALRLSEARFRLAAENASDVIWEVDIATGRGRSWGLIDRIMGPDGGDYPQTIEALKRLLHPEDRHLVDNAIDRCFKTGEPFHEEYRVVTASGEVRYWYSRGAVIRDTQANPWRCIGVSSDITERKRGEAALSHLAAVVESSDAAIVSKSLDGAVLTWNAAAERIYGYPLAEVKGRATPFLLPPDRLDEETDILRKIEQGEFIEHLETVRVRKGGARMHVLLTVSPLRDASGKVAGTCYVASDITERKRLEQQLAEAQKLESIGQLAAGIAHEINTPIQYVGYNVQFLQESFANLNPLLVTVQQWLSAKSSPLHPELLSEMERLLEQADPDYLRVEVPKCIQQSIEGLDHVARIVRALKEFSHPGPAEKVPADLNRAIDSTIQVSRNEWKSVADLVTDLDPDLPMVPCVTGEVNQVLLNLIINAAHAVGDALKDHPGQRGTITVGSRRIDQWAELRVQDTGTGIPEAIQAKVFDPFFTTKPVGKGTGQGLAIAHSVVVKRHGGTIVFETEPGKGTTFVVRLPLAAENAPPQQLKTES